MKKIGFLILTVLLSVSVYSQVGIKAGADYGTLSGHDAAKYRWGFHGGLTYDFQVSEKLYIQPAALLSLHSFGFKQKDIYHHGQVNKFFVEVPINVSFRPQISHSYDVKLVVDLGPYVKYGFAGDKNITLQNISVGDTRITGSSFDDSHGDPYQFNRLDAGVNAGLGVEVMKIYAGFSYQYSFVNGAKGDSDLHNSIIRFSLGYRF